MRHVLMVNCSQSSLTTSASIDASAGNGVAPVTIGRPVRAVSIGFRPGRALEDVCALVAAEAARGTDIIALPESFRGQNESSPESLDGPSVHALSEVARKYRTYVVCPIDRMEAGRRFNSALLLDRSGEIAAVYDKIHPVCFSEFDQQPPVAPGDHTTVCQTDFGRVGLATCFDVNWPDLWRELARDGAELVIWPSAYSGGRTLQAHALQNSYYILSATWVPDCRVYDIDGEQILCDRDNRGGGLNVSRVTLDLDRSIFHCDLNDSGPLEALLRDHPAEIIVEKRLASEGWFILKAIGPGSGARRLAARYGLEELREYLARSRRQIDERRANPVTSAFAAAGIAPG
jgi:predicted amidohydrolase